MTNSSAGNSKTKDPRGGRWGKAHKAETNRLIRRLGKAEARRG